MTVIGPGAEDVKAQLTDLGQRIHDFRGVFDVAGKQREIERLEALTQQPDFWADPRRRR